MVKTKKYREPLTELINLLIEEVSKQNECVRALSLNPDQAIETASQIQKIESEIDSKHRDLMNEVLKSVNGYRDLIAIKDVIQAIEDTSDAALRAADSTTIVALGRLDAGPAASTSKVPTGRLFENRIVVWDIEASRRLFKEAYYGKPLGIPKPKDFEFDAPLILDLMEGYYLVRKKKLKVEDQEGKTIQAEKLEQGLRRVVL